jgi:hypothetical protein
LSDEKVRQAVRRVLRQDLEGRGARPLKSYQRMFHGYEGIIEVEYRRLTDRIEASEGIEPAQAQPDDTPDPAPPPAEEPEPVGKYDALDRLADRDASRYAGGEEIARGGMGAILHVRDEHLNRDLAMKVVLESDSESGAGSTTRTPSPIGCMRTSHSARANARWRSSSCWPSRCFASRPKSAIADTPRRAHSRSLRNASTASATAARVRLGYPA